MTQYLLTMTDEVAAAVEEIRKCQGVPLVELIRNGIAQIGQNFHLPELAFVVRDTQGGISLDEVENLPPMSADVLAQLPENLEPVTLPLEPVDPAT